eukprot:Nk52_evm40s215 gene=Nk52_evmTU40s215
MLNRNLLCLGLLLILVSACVKGEQDSFDNRVLSDEEYLKEQSHRLYRRSSPFQHHKYESMVDLLKEYNHVYPELTSLFSIGKSVEGRDLWVMKISEKPKKLVGGIPQIKLVANIHGNEVVGKEMLLLLIGYLLENYGVDDRLTSIVRNTQLYILPSMNPDGYVRATPGECHGNVGRRNANNIDLNRNFPDQYFKTIANGEKRQPEVDAVMKWIESNHFVTSIALHGGAVVANYPYDNNKESKATYSACPDDDIFRYLARQYANTHTNMRNKVKCEAGDNFNGGITNGAAWYPLTGGMQDWNYLQAHCLELTVEISCCKFPLKGSDLQKYWNENALALLDFLDKSQIGVRGYVVDAKGAPIENAKITISGREGYTLSGFHGDYFRPLVPGKYSIVVSAKGHNSLIRTVSIKDENSPIVRTDFKLSETGSESENNDYRHDSEFEEKTDHNTVNEYKKPSTFVWIPVLIGVLICLAVIILLGMWISCRIVKCVRKKKVPKTFSAVDDYEEDCNGRETGGGLLDNESDGDQSDDGSDEFANHTKQEGREAVLLERIKDSIGDIDSRPSQGLS